MEMKVAVILSEAKDLQFRSEANQCRFFASPWTGRFRASLRMTDFRGSAARNLALISSATPHLDRQGEIPRCARNDTGDTAKNP